MAEVQTLARPYASAAFERARDADQLAQWSDALRALSAIVTHPDTAALVDNPEISDERLAELIIDVGANEFGVEARNLVRVLVDNTRLSIAPAIAEQFEALRAEAERWVDVKVVSAVDFSPEQRDALAGKLEQRLERSVRLNFEQDERVIGGAIIRAGDLVIDGSLSAQIERMRLSLTQ